MPYIYEYQFRFFLPLFLKTSENSDYCTYLFSSCHFNSNHSYIKYYSLYTRDSKCNSIIHESLNIYYKYM